MSIKAVARIKTQAHLQRVVRYSLAKTAWLGRILATKGTVETRQRDEYLKRRDQYLRQLLAVYVSPLARLREDYSVLRQDELIAEIAGVTARFEMDRQVMICSILGRLCPDIAERRTTAETAFEDLIPAIESRWLADDTPEAEMLRAVLQALCSLSTGDPGHDWHLLPGRLREASGDSSVHVQAVGWQDTRRGVDVPALSESDRAPLIATMLDQVIEDGLVPRFYDYDYLDDIVPIVEARYAAADGPHPERSRAVLQTLAALSAGDPMLDWSLLPGRLKAVLGEKHRYVPPRDQVNPYVREVIPDLVDEFCQLRAEDNVDRFLEINREYSRRQFAQQGPWDNRELSLLREYERDHHLLLRTLLGLIRDGKVGSDDEVLVIGPRHVDELDFLRKYLGLRNVTGLDLFGGDMGRIVGGDMHAMPFDSHRFRLVYSSGTLSYAYNVRRVVGEIARVSTRPGYVFLLDASDRPAGPDPLGRSDIVNVDTLIGLFCRHRFNVLARDRGKPLNPRTHRQNPCLAIELCEQPADAAR